jgi:hypothetical protein
MIRAALGRRSGRLLDLSEFASKVGFSRATLCMPTESHKPLIVISYAHADEPEHPAEGEVKWLSFVTGYLRPVIKQGAVDLWLDRLMPGGADWEREIEQKLRACDIFILLVSRHSLSSDYIVDKEIKIIRERQANGEAVHFYPLVLSPTPKVALDLVRDKNLRPRDGKPLSDFSVNDRYRQMNEAANEIANLVTRIVRKSEPPTSLRKTLTAGRAKQSQSAGQSPASLRPTTSDDTNAAIASVKDRESLERWLQDQPRETAVTIATRTALRVAPFTVRYPSLFASQVPNTFRATALARAAGKYPARANELRTVGFDAPYLSAGAVARNAREVVNAADYAYQAAYAAAYAAEAVEAYTNAAYAAAAIWAEIRIDAGTVVRGGVAALADRQLWSDGQPDWVEDHWAKLRSALPYREDWDVWIDWYEERLSGVPSDEAYDVVFATVPAEEWDKGPAAANAWIKAHLPK